MTAPRTMRAAVLCTTIAVSAAALAAAPATASDPTACVPATRTLQTKPYVTPLLLSTRGHVLALESDPGARADLWLHNPDGTVERVGAVNTPSPFGPADINAAGYVIGTDRGALSTLPSTPWVYRNGNYRTISTPTTVGDFIVSALNNQGATVGVLTNARTAAPWQTDYYARPQLWTTVSTLPITLPLPNAGYYVVDVAGRPLIDIRADGRISAVVDDHSGDRFLARWNDTASQPSLVSLPNGLAPTDVAGRWVVGTSQLTPSLGYGGVWSPADAALLTPDAGRLSDLLVSANGTYTGMVRVEASGNATETSIVGRATAAPHDVGSAGVAADVAGTQTGQLLLSTSSSVGVMTCALNLPASTHVTASAWS